MSRGVIVHALHIFVYCLPIVIVPAKITNTLYQTQYSHEKSKMLTQSTAESEKNCTDCTETPTMKPRTRRHVNKRKLTCAQAQMTSQPQTCPGVAGCS